MELNKPNSKKIFIAGPYNDPNETVKEYRVKAITEYCVSQFIKGNSPISPLLLGLSYAKHSNLPTDTKTWTSFSETLLKGCDEIHVLMINGWEESTVLDVK